MKHSLSALAVKTLKDLTGMRADLLVLDINAVYVVSSAQITKIEAVVAVPASPEPHEYDEVFPIDVQTLSADHFAFHPDGEPEYWYGVVAKGAVIQEIEVVRVAIEFPRESLRRPSLVNLNPDPGVNVVDCGVLVHTTEGALLAYQCHPRFGFHHLPRELLSSERAREMLPETYQFVPLGDPA